MCPEFLSTATQVLGYLWFTKGVTNLKLQQSGLFRPFHLAIDKSSSSRNLLCQIRTLTTVRRVASGELSHNGSDDRAFLDSLIHECSKIAKLMRLIRKTDYLDTSTALKLESITWEPPKIGTLEYTINRMRSSSERVESGRKMEIECFIPNWGIEVEERKSSIYCFEIKSSHGIVNLNFISVKLYIYM